MAGNGKAGVMSGFERSGTGGVWAMVLGVGLVVVVATGCGGDEGAAGAPLDPCSTCPAQTRCIADRCVPVGGVGGPTDGGDGPDRPTRECLVDAECADDNVCTEDRCVEGVCRHPSPEGYPCEDGDLCTTGDRCLSGVCTSGTVLSCDDGNPCTVGRCETTEGCVQEPVSDGEPCDDADACTDGDACVEGACAPGAAVRCDDGDACNGIERCHPERGCSSGAPPDCDDGLDCTEDACDGGTGCVHVPMDEVCDDGQSCTVDRCDDGRGCLHEADDAACDDGDACTVDACDPSRGCRSTPASCRDGVRCTTDTCDPALGCAFEADDAACDDGDACTAEYCDPELGCQSTRIDCDDGVACTADRCDVVRGCVHVPLDSACDDGDVCTGRERCDAELDCQAAPAPLACDDGVACTEDSCDPVAGCQHQAIDTACDDGIACTAERCDPRLGCLATPDDAACDDGSVCTPIDRCVVGVGCEHPSPLRCDDGSRCTDDTCDPLRGCASTPVVCDDGDGCTHDSCEPTRGCRAEVVPSLTCRPVFDIVRPLRGATLQSDIPEVVVEGSVVSQGAAIRSLRINGEAVTVGGDGSFTRTMVPTIGTNTLIFEATDSRGQAFRRVQSYVWSPQWRLPESAVAGSGMSDPGLGYMVGQETIDDGDHSLPMDDIGTLVDQLLSDFAIAGLLPYDILSYSGFSITNRGTSTGPASTRLFALSSGIRARVVFPNVNVTLYADGGRFLGTSWGSATATDVTIEGDIVLQVVDGRLEPVLNEQSVTVTFHGLSVSFSSGTVNSGASQVANALVNLWTPAIRVAAIAVFQNEAQPAIRDALSALAFSRTLGFPSPGAVSPDIDVQLTTRFARAQHLDGGVVLELAAGAYSNPATPYDILGVAGRSGCGAGLHDLRLPRQRPLELAFADDAFNQIVYAAWRGGFLEFDVAPDVVAALDLPDAASNVRLTVSGLLPPVLTDCRDGSMLVTLGDLRLDVSLRLLERDVSLRTYTTFTFRVSPRLEGATAHFDVTGVVSVDTEAQAASDLALGLETWLVSVIEDDVIPDIVAELGGIAIDVPTLSLGPGAHVGIQDTRLWRDQGNTLIDGNPTAAP